MTADRSSEPEPPGLKTVRRFEEIVTDLDAWEAEDLPLLQARMRM